MVMPVTMIAAATSIDSRKGSPSSSVPNATAMTGFT